MSGKHPFQLRDHGHKIIELIVHDPEIDPNHKSVETLRLLGKKFDQIILTLEETASLHPDILPILLKIGEFGALKVVAEDPEQIPFDLHGIPCFKNVFIATQRISGERTAEKILKQIRRIGAMRTSAYDLLQIMRNPDVKFEDIEEITAKDPELVMRMLQTANNAYFSRRVPVETLKSAVTYLGLEGIRQLLVHEMFLHFTSFFTNQRDKLAHMRRCSHLSAYLGKIIKANIPTIGKMRTAGLIHDLGSLAFSFYDSSNYSKVLSLVRKDNVSTAEAETRIFGVDHTYLGALYAKELGMPEYVTSVIQHHHDEEVDPENKVLMAVICANGFLNEKIEQINYTEFEPCFEYFADEINSQNPALQKYIQNKDAEDNEAEIPSDDEGTGNENSDNENLEEENSLSDSRFFKPMQFYGLLKEELDQFILAGAGSKEI